MQDVIRKTSRSQEISVNSFNEELCSSDRSGQPDKRNVAVQDDSEVYHEIKTLNTDNETTRERVEEDMDFKIPGLPHSTVKQMQSASVRELIQKIENHPNRHALQRDLRQSHSFNPFSPESKQMIHEVGNIELCELLDTEHKTQCKVCLSYWDIGIVYCTCGHFLRKGREENQKFIKYQRKGDLTDTDTVKSRETRNTTSSRRSARRRTSRVSMTHFVRDEQFRSRMIEIGRTEDFVAKWMILRTKIIPTI